MVKIALGLKNEPTKREIMDAVLQLHQAVGAGFTNVDRQMSHIRADVDGLRGEVDGLRGEVNGLRSEMHAGFRRVDERFDGLEGRVRLIELRQAK